MTNVPTNAIAQLTGAISGVISHTCNKMCDTNPPRFGLF